MQLKERSQACGLQGFLALVPRHGWKSDFLQGGLIRALLVRVLAPSARDALADDGLLGRLLRRQTDDAHIIGQLERSAENQQTDVVSQRSAVELGMDDFL